MFITIPHHIISFTFPILNCIISLHQFFPKKKTSWVVSCALRAPRIKPGQERSCRPQGKLCASPPSRGQELYYTSVPNTLCSVMNICPNSTLRVFYISNVTSKLQYFLLSQTGSEKPSVPLVPRGGNVSLSSHLRHVADGQSNGAVED